jgi:hypothetical protein
VWSESVASERRCPDNKLLSVAEAFQQEKSHLLPLPDNPFPTHERVEVHIGKTPYARFDTNDYSVPPTHVRQTLMVSADEHRVKICDQTQVLADHARCWDKGALIEDPAHLQQLTDHKRKARTHRGMDLLHHALPSSQKLFIELGKRGDNLGGATASLLQLLDRFGAQELETALQEVLAGQVVHLRAVHQVLEKRRQQQRLPVPVSRHLPANAHLHPPIKPHSLTDYDHLQEEKA